MKWFMSRGTKRKRVYVNGALLEDTGMVRPFLRSIGTHLERLRCVQFNPVQLRPFESLFSRLRSLTIRDVGTVLGAKDVEELLSCCAGTLQKLKLEYCIMGPFTAELPFPDLHDVYLRDSPMYLETLHKLIVSSPSLRSFYCDAVEEGNTCLELLATHCPLLKVLGFDNSGSAQSLIRVLEACPLIEVVELPREESNHHVLAALQHCARLKAFCAHGGAVTTSADCRAALQARLLDLRHLSLKDCEYESDAPILALAPHCSNLRTLELQYLGEEVSQEALVELVRHLPCVEELNLHDARHSDPVMKAIATHCRHLRVFHLRFAVGYTEDGVMAVAEACTQLQQLVVLPDNSVLTSSALQFLRALRPGLRVVHNTLDSVFWTSLWDVDRDEIVVV
jgi:hypothetical protein